MENESLLFDTSYIVSFCIVNDTNHVKAKELAEYLQTFSRKYTSNMVYAETATVLSQRLGKKEANILLDIFCQSGVVELFVDQPFHEMCKVEYSTWKNKNVSFIDMTLAILSRQEKIASIVSFDRHFIELGKKYGFKVIGI